MSLLPLHVFAQPETAPETALHIDDIISEVRGFFQWLARLPHVDERWLHLPPETGWPNLDEPTLRNRHRSEKAIHLLKHLPCLRLPEGEEDFYRRKRSVLFLPETLSIEYHARHVWDEFFEERCPTTEDVIWLGQADRWDGMSLLLDVEAGTITEFSLQPRGPRLVSAAETEALPKDQRWKSQPTWTVRSYFREARLHFERLVWIPKPSMLRGELVSWMFASRTGNGVVDDTHEDPDEVFEPSESSSESDSSSEEAGNIAADLKMDDIADEEVLALLADAGDCPLTARAKYLPPLYKEDTSSRALELKRVCDELMRIYQHHRWPSEEFDKRACTAELLKWSRSEEAREREEDKRRKEEALSRVNDFVRF